MRRLCRFALGLAAGCALCVTGHALLAWLVAAGLFAVLAVLRRRRIARRLLPVFLGAALAALWCAGYRAVRVQPLQALCAQKQTTLCAEILEYPQKTSYGYGVLGRMRVEGRYYQLVLYYSDEAALSPGDTVFCEAKLRAANADALGRDEYYASRGVWLRASARGTLSVQKGKPALRHLPVLAARRMQGVCAACFPGDAAGFLTALLTGDKSGLTFSQKNDLELAGIYHVVAVSGMHVSLLAGLVAALCAGRRRLGALLGVPLVWFFVLMTGANASAVRAGLMQTLLLLAPLAQREHDAPTALALALTVLLLENPWSLYNVGLLLSFSSTLGILLFAGKLSRAAMKSRSYSALREKAPRLARLFAPAITAVSCSVAASAFSLPICAVYFALVSVSGFLTNALCLGLISFVFSAGLAVCVLGIAAPALAAGAGWLLAWPVRLILWAVGLLARVPYGAVTLQSPYALIFTVFFFLTVWLLCLWPGKVRASLAAGSLLVVFSVCMALAALEYQSAGFTFTALDVGQGQCLVYTADGETSVIDCGGREDESGELAARYLLTNGAGTLERLILTHLDADHCNGARQLLSRVKVRTLYLPATAEDGSMKDALLRAAQAAGTEVQLVAEDLRFAAGESEIQIFAPNPAANSNDSGLCVLASREKYDILITGDLSRMAEYRLLSRHALQEIELLVAGHHGAATSTSAALLSRTGAATVVLSVGADNSYGHPAAETLARIEDAGAAIYRTDENGTITIRGGSYGKETLAAGR